MARDPEKALYLVTLVHGGQAEVEAADLRDLKDAIYKGRLLDGRYVGSSGSFPWLVNAKYIVVVVEKIEPKAASSE